MKQFQCRPRHHTVQKLWAHPDIESRIEDGIAQHRKTRLRVSVTDKNGTPVHGAKVHVEQTALDWLMGSGDFDLTEDQRFSELRNKIFNLGHLWVAGWNSCEPAPERPVTDYFNCYKYMGVRCRICKNIIRKSTPFMEITESP
jgi:hypothetical protein